MAQPKPLPRKKVELHIHLDGAVRPTTAWELALEKGIKIPGVSNFIEYENALRVQKPTNLFGFLTHFGLFWPPFLGDLDAIERVAYEFCEDQYYAGVIYCEPRYSPRLALGDDAIRQLGPSALDEVIIRITNGLRRGEHDFGVKTKQILCSKWTKDSNDLQETLNLCRKHFDKGVTGIDLLTIQPPQGVIDEAPFVEPIISVWREAAQTGVHRTIHAGEMGTAHSVARAAFQLGSERVGHGYHVVDDLSIYQECIDKNIHFECCPYSSLMTGSLGDWGENHSIYRFVVDGANFSVNSDDPTVTGHTVQRDYELLASWGINSSILAQTNINGVKASFQTEGEKNEILRELTAANPIDPEELVPLDPHSPYNIWRDKTLKRNRAPQATQSRYPADSHCQYADDTHSHYSHVSQSQHPYVTQSQNPCVTRQSQYPSVTRSQQPYVTQSQNPCATQIQNPCVTRSQQPYVTQSQHPCVTRSRKPEEIESYDTFDDEYDEEDDA